MSQNENEQIKAIFSRVNRVEAPPYMKTRVLAQIRAERESKRKVRIWQFVSLGSLSALVLTLFVGFRLFSELSADAVVRQAYVIHIDFTQNEQHAVAKAEIELPKDVHFVSKSANLSDVQKLRLPVDVKSAGRGKLPFVVSSESAGEKRIVVRLLDQDDQVIREQVLNYRFAKQDIHIL